MDTEIDYIDLIKQKNIHLVLMSIFFDLLIIVTTWKDMCTDHWYGYSMAVLIAVGCWFSFENLRENWNFDENSM